MVNVFSETIDATQMSKLEALGMHRKTKRRLTTKEGRGIQRRFGVPCAALLLAAGVFVALPHHVFLTEAVVGVGDSATPLRETLSEAAVLAAVSKPVMSRAASSLIGTTVEAPAPDLVDRVRVALRIDHAAGHDARLVGTLEDAVEAKTGDTPGIVKIFAHATDACAAADIATAVAEALIADRDIETVARRHRQEVRVAREIEGLKASALAAHGRLAALGGSDVDPAQARVAAAAQISAAQARLDVVRTIVASGTPPLSDRHDLPQTVASLQSAYLDLSQQLAKARETLGDRHTTVISLQDGTKRAGVALTTEWKRLSKIAENELDAARQHEAALTAAAKAPADAGKMAAQDDARRAAMVADEALAQAERARSDAPTDEQAYRLLAPAPVPSQASGLASSSRLVLSMLVALLVLGVPRALVRVSRFMPIRWTLAKAMPDMPIPARQTAEPSIHPEALPADAIEPKLDRPAVFADMRPPVETRLRPRVPARRQAPVRQEVAQDPDRSLSDAMRDILPALDSITPQGDLPVVLIGTNDAASATTPMALALGAAAAAAGLRVLVVETSGSGLAASVEHDAEPVLVDVFGMLRVALRADADVSDAMVYLAPTFRNNHRIVAGLARTEAVPLVDDLAAEFDLVIIDAGLATSGADVAACADAFLRVGHHPSKRDDDLFLAALEAPRGAFLGAITASAFVPKPQEGLHLVHPLRDTDRSISQPGSRPVRSPVRPAVVERRKVGIR